MSLRATLAAAVARCIPQYTQPATSGACGATGDATAVQLTAANPYAARERHATIGATPMQPRLIEGATDHQKLHVAFASTRNTQPGPMTVHRLASDLMAAALHACDRHSDDPIARDHMRADVLRTPPELMPDLLEHFRTAYPKGTP